MIKNQKRTIMIAALIFIIFSIIVFSIPFVKTATFWVAYLFVLLSIVVLVFIMNYALVKEPDAKSKLYGFPLAKLSFIYLIAQIVLSLIFDCFAKYIPAWIPTCLFVVLFAAVSIGFITIDAVKEEVQRQDIKIRIDTNTMQDLRSRVYALPTQCKNEDLKKRLEEIADEFRYSDPVSSEALEDIENDLLSMVQELQQSVIDDDYNSSIELCQNIKITLMERNRKCRLNKGKN